MMFSKEIAMTIVYIVMGWIGLSLILSPIIGAFIRAGKGGPDELG